MIEKEKKTIHIGYIIECFPNGMFRVHLENDDLVLGYISGKIRSKSIRILLGDKVQIEVSHYDLIEVGRIRILLGDKVQIEVSHYDLTKGRIIFRFERSDSKD
uniref:translational initiation factor 1 n=1 Tax=Incarvillea lutea TaxID=291316 RepID=UPI0021CCEB57|nr:translational initiation factor 1 [Incarvillea lutea]UWK23448.1 translational initiation factor 1 [Incarvillea lutea]